MAKDKPPKKPADDAADAERFEDAVRRLLAAPKPKQPPAKNQKRGRD